MSKNSSTIFVQYVDAVDLAKRENEKDLYIRVIRIGLNLIDNKNVYLPTKQAIERDVKTFMDMVKNWNDNKTNTKNNNASSSSSNATPEIGSNEIPTETWEDIVGLERTKKVIYLAIVMSNKQSTIMKDINAEQQNSMLFYGPPGTGKTLFARAVANKLQYPYFEMQLSGTLGKYLGDTEKQIRNVFNEVIKLGKVVLFCDELESLVPQRNESESSQSRNGGTTEFLQCMDLLKKHPNILFIGATNHKRMIDAAFVRRFTLITCIPLPTRAARRSMILKFYSDADRKSYLDPNQDLDELVEMTSGYNVADMKRAVNDAKLAPVREAMDFTRWSQNESGFWYPDENGVLKDAADIEENKMLLSRSPNYDDLYQSIKTTQTTSRMDEVNKLYEEAGVELRDRD